MAFNTPKFNDPTNPPLPFLSTMSLTNILSTKKLDKQYEKLGKNVGFLDASFQAMMKSVGWQGGQAWCAYYVKLIYMQLFSFDREWLSKNITGSAMGNLNSVINLNSKGDKRYIAIKNNDEPVVGDVFCLGVVGDGHTGIVTEILGKSGNGWKVKTIEGNTGASGTREGDKTASLTRTLELGVVSKGSSKAFKGYWRRNFTKDELANIVYDEAQGTYVMKTKTVFSDEQWKTNPLNPFAKF
jgi:hypothetical protein